MSLQRKNKKIVHFSGKIKIKAPRKSIFSAKVCEKIRFLWNPKNLFPLSSYSHSSVLWACRYQTQIMLFLTLGLGHTGGPLHRSLVSPSKIPPLLAQNCI